MFQDHNHYKCLLQTNVVVAASYILCLFSWPVTLFFSLAVTIASWGGSVLIWCHQVARIVLVELYSRNIWCQHRFFVIRPISLAYMSFLLSQESIKSASFFPSKRCCSFQSKRIFRKNWGCTFWRIDLWSKEVPSACWIELELLDWKADALLI